MPGGFGQMFAKIMGPLQTAIGLGAAPFTGGATLPIAMSGLSSMTAPGGVLGASTPTLPSIKAPALTSAPIGPSAPDIPTPAGQGLTLSGGGAGPPTSTGAGVASPDVMSQAIANAMGGGGADPFAQYGGFGAAA